MLSSQRLFLNTFFQILGRAGVVFFSLLTTARLTRELGQAGYGVYGLITTAIAVFFSFADWGTQMIASREAAKNPAQKAVIFGDCLFFRSLLGLLASGFFLIFIFLNPSLSGFRSPAAWASLILIFFSLKTTAEIIFQVELKMHFTALTELLAAAAFWLILQFNPSLSLGKTVGALLFSAFLSAVFGFFLSLRLVKPRFSFARSRLVFFARESFTMGALLTVFAVYNRLDVFFLQSLQGNEAVGVYLLAYKVHDNLILAAAYFMTAFFPVIAGFANSSSQFKSSQLRRILSQGWDLLFAMALAVIGGVYLFSPLIVRVLGGETFSASAPVLRILVFATALGYLNHFTGYSLAALGWQQTHLKFGLLALVFSFFLNWFLVSRFSVFGAAWATVLTELFVLFLTTSFLQRRLGFRFSLWRFFPAVLKFVRQKGRLF